MKICPDCKRHVRNSDSSCPFCGTRVPTTTGLALAVSLGLAAGITGCGPAVDAGNSMGDSGASGSTNGSTGSPQTSGPAVTTASSIGTTGTGDATTSPSSTGFFGSSGGTEESTGVGRFIQDPDGGGGVYGIECSVWEQDCARGEKCVPWANDGGDVLNATICRPIVPRGQAAGEPCVVEESPVLGVDDCDANSYCFDVDPQTLAGTCVAFCLGDELEPSCADPNQACVIENEGSVTFCLDTCDPLGAGCDDARSCVAVRPETFVCARPGESIVGEDCTQFVDCLPGLSCLQNEDVDAVCTSPCPPLDGVCEPGSSCLPWGEAGLCMPDEP